MREISLREVAHVRAGEKGDKVNLAIVPYRPEDYPMLVEQVTTGALRETFGPVVRGAIHVYRVPGISSLNIVLDAALDGGRSRNILFDESGKALSGLALGMAIEVHDGFIPWSEDTSGLRVQSDDSSRGSSGLGIRIGCATGWARDRFEPAITMAREGQLDYLCFETMSEVTMSAAQVARRDDSRATGFDPYLLERLVPAVENCRVSGTKIITNQGWLDPEGAAKELVKALRNAGLPDVRVAAVLGGDLTDRIANLGLDFEGGGAISDRADDIVSAEAYLGATEIASALGEGADVVITPRVTDASLFVGPLVHEFGWGPESWDELGMAVTIGHLLECGAQVSGGYFADPGYKDVDGLADVGYPIAEVFPEAATITKTAGTGGLVSPRTCKEQLLYEVGDPASYLNPDVTADFSNVTFRTVGRNRVEATGFSGRPAPPTLKALVGLSEGWTSEQFVLYAGPGAMDRSRLAESILRERLGRQGFDGDRIRFDRVGLNAIHREATPEGARDPYEVALRVAIRGATRGEVDTLRREVDPMAATGPAGTGKWAPMSDTSRPVIGLSSTLVPRDAVDTEIVHMTS